MATARQGFKSLFFYILAVGPGASNLFNFYELSLSQLCNGNEDTYTDCNYIEVIFVVNCPRLNHSKKKMPLVPYLRSSVPVHSSHHQSWYY